MGSTLDPGDVGRDESMSKPLSNRALLRYIDCGELGTDDGAKSDSWADWIDQRLFGEAGVGMVTDVCDNIALAVSPVLAGVPGYCDPRGGTNTAVLIGIRFFFGRRISSFFGA